MKMRSTLNVPLRITKGVLAIICEISVDLDEFLDLDEFCL